MSTPEKPDNDRAPDRQDAPPGKTCSPQSDRDEGTSGAGNPSPGGASRTGGATGGVHPNPPSQAKPK